VPVRAARELGAARVVAVDIAYRPHEAPVGTPLDAAFQALHIAVNALIGVQAQRLDAEGTIGHGGSGLRCRLPAV
jgi:hypothetical protein